jgi:tetratricopeptide (TPR) repeat protein
MPWLKNAMPSNLRPSNNRRPRKCNYFVYALLLFLLLSTPGHSAKKKKMKGASQTPGVHSRLQEALAQEIEAVQLANSGRYEEAMEGFKTVITILELLGDGTHGVSQVKGRAYTFMGHIYTILGQLPLGLKFWKKGIKFDPTISDARRNIIKSLSDQGDHRQALKYASQVANSSSV